MVEKLLCRDGIAPGKGNQYGSGAVKLHTVGRAEQEDQNIVQRDINEHDAQSKGDIFYPQLCHTEKDQGEDRQKYQQRRIKARHGGNAPQEQTYKLACTGKPVDGGGAVNIIEQVGHLRTS